MLIAVILILLLIAAYLFAIVPGHRRINAEPLKNRDYAHRGLWNAERPENSLAAFAAARDAGYGIELDVHLTADGCLVVHHDDSLKRMCGKDIKIGSSTREEVCACRLKDTDEHVPTFDEVLAVVDGRIPMIVELKTENNVDALCRAVEERMRRYDGVWCMESFDPRAVRWFRRHASEIIRGQLANGGSILKAKPGKRRDILVLKSQLGNALGRPDFIAYQAATDNNLPMKLVRLMRPLLVCWTIRSQEMMDRQRSRYDIQIFEGFIPREPSPRG